MEKNNPLIIALPRTGSTVITKILFNIAHHLYGSKNYLNQFITVSPHYRERFNRIDGVVQSLEYLREKDAFHKEFQSREYIISQRLKLMTGDVKYTTKVFAHDFTSESYAFFSKHFDFILLERRDRLTQLLSFCTMMQTNKFEYANGEIIQEAHFDYRYCPTFLGLMLQYQKIKAKNPKAKVIYYEDFMEKGGDTAALVQLLGMEPQDIPETLPITTIPTPYVNLEDLLENKSEWLEAKPVLNKLLNSIEF